jgi:DNA-binding NarL/FixJ family response regulator
MDAFARDRTGVSATADSVSDPALPVRVAVLCEVRLYREAIAALLSEADGLEVVGTAAGPRNLPEQVRKASADVALLGVVRESGIDAIRETARHLPAGKVLVLGLSEPEDDVIAWVEAGAVGCVPRECTLESSVHAIKRVAAGEAFYSPRATASLSRRVRGLAADEALQCEQALLTARETQVLRLIRQGLSNKEISLHLSIEVATVKNHVHSILRKLNLHRRGDAAAWLREH